MNRDHAQKLLGQAARLQSLATISKARRLVQASGQLDRAIQRVNGGRTDPALASGLDMPLHGELMASVALRLDGSRFGDSVEEQVEADGVEAELVRLGTVSLRVVDHNARALALSTGAVEEGDDRPCMLAQFEPGELQPCIGQYLVIDTGVRGVGLSFLVWLTHADLPDDADHGAEGELNPALADLKPGHALLVQQLPGGGA